MHFLSYLRAFTDSDLKEFKLFLSSPFFKIPEIAIRLFDLTIKQDLLNSENKLDKTKLFQSLFKTKKAYNSQKISKVAFQLTNAIEEYLAINQLKKNKSVNRQLQLTALKEKELIKLYKNKAKKSIQTLEQGEYRDWSFHLDNFLINHNLFLHPDTAKSGTSIESLQKANYHLDLFYTMVKMRFETEVSFRKKWSNDQTKIPHMDEVFSILEKQKDKTLELYIKILDLSNHSVFQEKTFKSILKNLKKSFQLLSPPEQSLTYSFLTNYISSFVNKGQHQYSPIQLKLFKIALDEKLIIENNRMTDTSFINIVITHAFCKKFVPAMEFIKNYKQYLAPEISKSAVALSKVYLSFHQKKHEEAIKYINTATTHAPHYKLRTRSLYIRCLYERFLIDKRGTKKYFLSELTNYKQYFNRMQLLSSARKTNYQNLGTAIRKMTDIIIFPEGKLRDTKKKRLQNFVQENSIIAKPWVLEKMKQLESV